MFKLHVLRHSEKGSAMGENLWAHTFKTTMGGVEWGPDR